MRTYGLSFVYTIAKKGKDAFPDSSCNHIIILPQIIYNSVVGHIIKDEENLPQAGKLS